MARRTSRPARPADDERSDARERALILLYEAETKGIAPAEVLAAQVATDVEIHGQTVPADSAILLMLGAANRDRRKFNDPERFDIHRDITQHLTFGYGIHFCLGAALGRLEGVVALDEILTRFPEWEVDMDNAHLSPTSTVRGWETLPVTTAVR